MEVKSPPKHRHDGESPLPLGMDWSPPPRKWSGQDTVWPHDFRTGWSYCVIIPSWVILPKSRDSDPVVFYRVFVGLQSPEGVTSARVVLRRFNDFLKLFSDMKKTFPKKSIPAAPSKGILRVRSRVMLEERRLSLEQWLATLLSDIDMSRSIIVASFLELEASARSSFQVIDQGAPGENLLSSSSTSSPFLFSSGQNQLSIAEILSMASDYGSDTAYETSELGTPRPLRDAISEVGTEDLSLEKDLPSPVEKLLKQRVSNVDNGLFMGQCILDQLECHPSYTMYPKEGAILPQMDTENGILGGERALSSTDKFYGDEVGHTKKLSNGSVDSDKSSLKGSEMASSKNPISAVELFSDIYRGHGTTGDVEISRSKDVQQPMDGVEILLPLDQRQKVSRVMMTLQRRLMTAKADMEDLITRLDQEVAVKDYLLTKIKDLEVELETSRQKSRDNLKHAVLLEREKVTQMQWDMEELRRKSMEVELRMKYEKDEYALKEQTASSTPTEEALMRELEATKTELQNERKMNEDVNKWRRFPRGYTRRDDSMLKEMEDMKGELQNARARYEELHKSSKSDIKVLVKEVKALRISQTSLKQQLSESVEERDEIERKLCEEKLKKNIGRSRWRRILDDCRAFHNQLEDCEDHTRFQDADDSLEELPTPFSEHLTTSENQTADPLIAQGRKFKAMEVATMDKSKGLEVKPSESNEGEEEEEEEIRAVMNELMADNILLRKRLNLAISHTVEKKTSAVEMVGGEVSAEIHV